MGDILFDDIALDQLLAGPNADEMHLGMESALPNGLEADVTVEDGVATVELEGEAELTREALAQIVYTETAFAARRVGGDRRRDATCASDFEEQTPSVLVESPLPFEEVTSPITATGTANTFEANFQYELLNADGKVIDENFVTATSGTGTRGHLRVHDRGRRRRRDARRLRELRRGRLAHARSRDPADPAP